MATKKFCDVCNQEVEKFHEYGGNISDFGVNEACDSCWKYLDTIGKEKRDSLVKKQEAALEKLDKAILADARKETLK